MTLILAGADIRGYYAALGIHIPDWAQNNASVRCFADPDAHTRGDQHPSCSVNLQHGAWACHGCGTAGGAYDAATVRGYAPRDAIDLMVAYGLVQRRPYRNPQPARREGASPRPHRGPAHKPFAVTERQFVSWRLALSENRELLRQLEYSHGWSIQAIEELGLGVDRGRIVIPVRTPVGELQGVLRYRPERIQGEPKMVAVPGTRLGLIPHPACSQSRQIVLTEGPPDMIAGRSVGLPTIAVPGAHAWRTEWSRWFRARDVTVFVDSDPQGRAAGERIAHDLAGVAQTAKVFDLAPERDDGYDLTDWLTNTACNDIHLVAETGERGGRS